MLADADIRRKQSIYFVYLCVCVWLSVCACYFGEFEFPIWLPFPLWYYFSVVKFCEKKLGCMCTPVYMMKWALVCICVVVTTCLSVRLANYSIYPFYPFSVSVTRYRPFEEERKIRILHLYMLCRLVLETAWLVYGNRLICTLTLISIPNTHIDDAGATSTSHWNGEKVSNRVLNEVYWVRVVLREYHIEYV